MSPVVIGLVSLLCFVAASLLGLWLGYVIPEAQFTDRNRDLIKEARRMLVALASMTLGLIIAAATSSFETRKNEVETSASRIIALDSTLGKYGEPALEARKILRAMVERGIERIDIAAIEGFSSEKTRKGIGVNRLQLKLFELEPKNDRETWLRSSALSISNELVGARWLQYASAEGNIKWPFLMTMIFWLMGVFVSYGLVAPRNWTSFWTMFVVAVAVAMAIHLTLDLDTPNQGMIEISSAPLRLALEQIGPLL